MIKAVKDSHDGNDDIDDEEEEKEGGWVHLPGASRPVWEALNTTALVLRIRKVVITFEIHIEIEVINHDGIFKFSFERKLYPFKGGLQKLHSGFCLLRRGGEYPPFR